MSLRSEGRQAMQHLLRELDPHEVKPRPLTLRLRAFFNEMLRQRREQLFGTRRRGGLAGRGLDDRRSRFHRRMSSWRKRQGVVR